VAFDLSTAKPASNLGFDLSTARPVDDVSDDFARGEAHQDILGTPPQPKPTPGPGTLEKLKGAGEAALSTATSIPSQFAGNIAGLVRSIVSGKFGTDEGVREGAKQAQRTASSTTYEPKTEAGKDALGRVGDFVQQSGIAGINPATLPSGALARASRGQAVEALGPEAYTVGRAAGAAKSAAMPRADVAALARKAQKLGIDLRPDMLTDNRILRSMGEALEKVPLSGSRDEARQVAFNRALTNLIGGDRNAKQLTPDVFDKAITKSGETIGTITGRHDIPHAQMKVSLDAAVEEASKFEMADVAKILSNYAKEIDGKAVNGVVPGKALRKINSAIGKRARETTNGDLRNALSDFQDKIHDAVEATLSGDELAQLTEARRQYAIAKAIEPLVAKAAKGDISPAGLMQAVTSDRTKKSLMARGKAGDLGDLARIGQLFLKEPGSSGSIERAAAYGLIGGGAAIEPHTAATVYGLANLYNRAGPAISRRLTKLSPDERNTPIRDLQEAE
jgi:hypothetical protein